eukprot:162434_1
MKAVFALTSAFTFAFGAPCYPLDVCSGKASYYAATIRSGSTFSCTDGTLMQNHWDNSECTGDPTASYVFGNTSTGCYDISCDNTDCDYIKKREYIYPALPPYLPEADPAECNAVGFSDSITPYGCNVCSSVISLYFDCRDDWYETKTFLAGDCDGDALYKWDGYEGCSNVTVTNSGTVEEEFKHFDILHCGAMRHQISVLLMLIIF